MSYVVARMQKLKADNLVGLGNHDQRKTKNHSNQEIDVNRSYLNYDLVAGRTKNFKTDIQKYVDENKAGQRATRKDAVLANEWVITSDKSFFEKLSADETKRYFETVKDYFANNFGDENIRYAIVHLDEHTPHMHMGIVPFDNEQKLSAKRVFNREALQKIQDDLPKFLKQKGFEIERGEKNTERKNLTIPEYKAMQQELETVKADTKKQKQELAKYQFPDEDDVKIARTPARFKKGYSVVQNVALDMLERDAGQGQVAHKLFVDFERQNETLREENQKLRATNADLAEKNQRLTKTLTNAQNLIKRMAQVLKQKLGDKLHIKPEAWRKVGLEAPNKPNKRVERKSDRNIGPSR